MEILKILFIMDPVETIKPEKDTSYFLMQGAESCGFEVFHALSEKLHLENRNVFVEAQGVKTQNLIEGFIQIDSPQQHPIEFFDFVFIRKDPPFNQEYLHLTQILDFAPHSVTVVNRPQSLRDFNEKLLALHFSDYIPRTVVTPEYEVARQFAVQFEKIVIKPIDGFGGKGIKILDSKEMVSMSSHFSGTRFVIQEYVQEAELGDKRIILVDGDPVGAILRKASEPGKLNNLDQGGVAHFSVLTDHEARLCEELGPFFRDKGLFFVGIDLLGNYLTEINITSPTGLREMSQFLSTNLSLTVMEKLVEKRIYKSNRTYF